MAAKQYGLILPNKIKSHEPLGQRKLVPKFDSDEELQKSDEETSLDWVDSMMKKSVGNAAVRATQKRHIREAQEQDPTVFQYDEIYDDMKSETEIKKKKLKGDIDKKPKYIGNILKQAAKRKLENERRMERKVQKERDEEGDEFADKESFVTESFIKKMKELKEADEQERKDLALEELRDVKKHKNFSAFYGHILEQTVKSENKVDKENEDKDEIKLVKRKDKNYRRRSNSRDSSSDGEVSSPIKRAKVHTVSSDSADSDSSNSDNSKESANAVKSKKNTVPSVINKPKPLQERDRILEIKKLFAKRTVGEIFEKAVQRFFQRKAAASL